MNEIEECHEVLHQVNTLFQNREEDLNKLSNLSNSLKEIEDLRAQQVSKLAEKVREFDEQKRRAEQKLVHIPSDMDFQELMEGMEEDKFSIAKNINSLESTCQNLQRVHTNIQSQLQLLQDVTDVVVGISNMKLDMARAIPGSSAELSTDIIGRRPEVVQKVSALGQIIQELEANPSLVSSSPLRETLESLKNPNKLRHEIDDLKHRHEYSSICQLLSLVAKVEWATWETEGNAVEGTISAGHRYKDSHTFRYDADKYSKVFIANHMWDVVDSMEDKRTPVPRKS
eukprot:CFRG1745T1